MGVSVKTTKMAESLEYGIGTTESLAAMLPRESRLRYPVCGLVATAIHNYAQKRNIDSKLYISTPNFPFDMSIRHIFPVLETPKELPFVIDAAPSQFLDYVGLSPSYEFRTGERVFLPEKVLMFDLDDPYLAVHWLTKSVRHFRKTANHLKDLSLHDHPLLTADDEALETSYSRIWNQANIEPWTPSSDLKEVGTAISETLPEDLITIW